MPQAPQLVILISNWLYLRIEQKENAIRFIFGLFTVYKHSLSLMDGLEDRMDFSLLHLTVTISQGSQSRDQEIWQGRLPHSTESIDSFHNRDLLTTIALLALVFRQWSSRRKLLNVQTARENDIISTLYNQ